MAQETEELPPFFQKRDPITNPSKMLIRYGFWDKDNKKAKEKFGSLKWDKDDTIWRDVLSKLKEEDAEKFAYEHVYELVKNQMFRSGYPKPTKHYHLMYETFNKPVESFYYWSMNAFRDLGFAEVDKINDLFAASEQSAFYGAAAQRLSLAEDRVVQYVASIGKMVRELFQMVREIRVIKERLTLYTGTQAKSQKAREHFEVALKGLYVDMVEGGAKNTTSVFGMASQLQFTALPDLFFSTNPKKVEDISKVVDDLGFNERMSSVLKRKLTAYMTWKDATFQELKDRERHMIKYLRQHYDMIQLYMQWVKPYLRHVKRLHMDKKKIDSADLVAAFEGSMVEIEVLAKTMPKGNEKVYGCLLLTLNYRTSPAMSFAREGRHQGPIHMGLIDMQWRTYAWTQDDINRYKKMRDAETFQMLAEIDDSIREAMAGVGSSLEEYIKEAKMSVEERKEKMIKEKKEAEKRAKMEKKEAQGSLWEQIGMKDAVDSIKGALKEDTESKKKAKMKKEVKAAEGAVGGPCWLHYRNLKKSNRMIQW
ncbi:MAG: hypothetical protein ACE5FT_06170 [Candidatus Nanoarchaeia archaeon]